MVLVRFFSPLFILWWASAAPAAMAASKGIIYGKVEIQSKNHQPLGNSSGAVVYLKEVNGNKGFSPSGSRPSMASENMRFTPEVLPVLAGTSVVFPNNDDMIHNAFSISEAKKFDFGRYGYGEENSALFDKPGLVSVYCKIHPKMAGYILVLSNPYFTVTDKEGNYSLEGVPAGNYTLVCWFPYGDSQEKKVDLTQETKAEADFSLLKLRATNPRKNTADKK